MQDGVKKKRVFCNECKTVSTYLPGFNLDNKSLYLIDSDLRTIKEPGLNSTYLLVFHVSIWTCRDIRYPGLVNYLATLGGMTKRYQHLSALHRQNRTGARLVVFWGHFLG